MITYNNNAFLKVFYLFSIIGICISILWIGYSTLTALVNMFAPQPAFCMGLSDWYYEVRIVSAALNWALPLGIFSIVFLAIIGIVLKSVNYTMILISLYSLTGVTLCCLMFFQFMGSFYEDVSLWSSVWWII